LTYIERFDDAVEQLSVAFEFAHRDFGMLDWRTMTVKANLGAAISKAGQQERGEAMLLSALANRREVLGADDFSHALTKSLLADHYLRYQQPAIALEWVNLALANLDRARAADSTAAMLAHSHRGRALWRLDREVEARQSFDRAIQLADQLAEDAGTNYLVVMDACLAFLSVTDPDAASALLHAVQQSGELEKTPRRPEARRISAWAGRLSAHHTAQ
jgi:tetratricopeptide (TPR) repeat protein